MPPAEPLGWADFVAGLEIFREAILCGAVAGLVLGYLGVFIVLRRMAFISATISHAAGLGVACAFYAQIHLGAGAAADPTLLAFAFGVGATLLLSLDGRRLGATRESLVALVFIVTSGASLLVGDRIAQESHDIQAIIFGTAVLVSPRDLTLTVGAGALVLLGHLWLRRGLIFASFDGESARVQQLPVRLLELFLLISVGLMVSVATRALGAMPVFAFSVLPALAALSLSRRVELVFLLAGLLGAATAVVGYALSFFLRLPVGASQTVLAGVVALLALGLGRLRG